MGCLMPGSLTGVSRRKKFLIGLSLTLGSVALVVLMIEASFRAIGFYPGMPRHGSPYYKCIVWDKYTHHGTKPSCSITAPPRNEDGIPQLRIEYNSLGLRGPEIGSKRVPRVLLLGDSFVEADEMVFEETMGQVLSRLTSQYEFLQQGVSSWSPLTEFAWLRVYGRGLGIDQVYLFVDDNDFFSSMGYAQSDQAYREWLTRSRVVALISSVFKRPPRAGDDKEVEVPASLKPFVKSSSLSREVWERLMLRQDPTLWDDLLMTGAQSTVRSIFEFARYAAKKGIGLTVVYIPLGIDIDSNETTGGRQGLQLVDGTYFSESGLERWLMQILRSKRIAFINLREPLEQAKRSLVSDGSNVLYFQFDGHFTPAAHKVVARALLSDLQRSGPQPRDP